MGSPAGRGGSQRRASGATTETTSNPYEDVLADTYESAYARRLRASSRRRTGCRRATMISVTAALSTTCRPTTPAFYNVMVMGDQVWSRAQIHHRHVRRGAARRSTWTRGTTAGTGVPISSWGFSFGSWGWGFGPWYDPWYYPGWGHGWGWGHPHWGPPHWGGHPHRPTPRTSYTVPIPIPHPRRAAATTTVTNVSAPTGRAARRTAAAATAISAYATRRRAIRTPGRAPRRTVATTVAATRIRRTATTRARQHLQPRRLDEQQFGELVQPRQQQLGLVVQLGQLQPGRQHGRLIQPRRRGGSSRNAGGR